MKKLFSIFLILITCTILSVFADNKDNFTPKEYVLNIPQTAQDNNTDWTYTHFYQRWYACEGGKVTDYFVAITKIPVFETKSNNLNNTMFYAYSRKDNKYYKFKEEKGFWNRNDLDTASPVSTSTKLIPINQEEIPTELMNTIRMLNDAITQIGYVNSGHAILKQESGAGHVDGICGQNINSLMPIIKFDEYYCTKCKKYHELQETISPERKNKYEKDFSNILIN